MVVVVSCLLAGWGVCFPFCFSPCPTRSCIFPAQVVSGQALQSICLAARGAGSRGGDDPASAGCLRLTWWILIFSASQLVLCLLPDINSLTAVTALGAATTLGFAGLATVGAAVHGEALHGAPSQQLVHPLVVAVSGSLAIKLGCLCWGVLVTAATIVWFACSTNETELSLLLVPTESMLYSACLRWFLQHLSALTPFRAGARRQLRVAGQPC